MSKEADSLEGLHYSILEKWVQNGKVDKLPEGMESYLEHLTAVSGFYNRGKNKTQIIKMLRNVFRLDYSQAKNRYVDATNFFYLDNDIKFDAYMNLYADKLDKIADLITQTSTSPEEHLLAVKPIIEAAKLRASIKPTETLPDEFFTKPYKVYTMKLEDLGVHEPINRNLIGAMIDEMQLDEATKIRIKGDAEVGPKTLFKEDEQES